MNRGMINIALQMRGEGHNQVSQTRGLSVILRKAKKDFRSARSLIPTSTPSVQREGGPSINGTTSADAAVVGFWLS